MTTPLVTKIVLKNTTKMSLNERFTAYRAQAQSSTNTFRQKIQMQRQATSANLRLAQQMANRPTVIAALRLKKRSLQQRLGGRQQSTSNVKARLNLNAQRMTNNTGIQGRLGNFRGRGATSRGSFKPGTSPLLKARLGLPRPTYNQRGQQSRGQYRNRRGNFQVGNRQNFQVGNRQNFQNRGKEGGNRLPASRNARGGRGNRGGSRGRGGIGRWGGSNTVTALPTKQELDNQLDAYMAETKGSLDAQLGDYMLQG